MWDVFFATVTFSNILNHLEEIHDRTHFSVQNCKRQLKIRIFQFAKMQL